MTDASILEAFLARIGPLASEDYAAHQRHTAEEAPEFRALSFFHARETIVSQIIGYLLKPTAQHGQGQLFFKAFLTALDLKCENARSVTVQVEPPCYTLGSRRRMDILIRFVTNGAENILAIESKSHFAGDQDYQVQDYLEHLRSAYRHASFCRLYYLKNAKAPEDTSISKDKWDSAVSEGRCKACSFREVMSVWLVRCRSEVRSQKIRAFLDDFAAFIGLNEENVMANGNKVRGRVIEILEKRRSNPEDVSPDFEALLAVYALHLDVWNEALAGCMDRVSSLLHEQLPEWKIKTEPSFQNGHSYFQMKLWKGADWTTTADGKPNLCVVLATEDHAQDKGQRELHRPPTYLVVFVSRAQGFSPKGVDFNKLDEMRIDSGRNQYTIPLRLGDVEDLRSEAGVRYLLDTQSSSDIAAEVVVFISRVEVQMDACFRPKSGQRTQFQD
jgi:hypothetical protein